MLDVFAVGSAAALPVDLDPFSDFAIAAPDGVVWYGRSGGYFWLLPSTTARECFRRVTGGQPIGLGSSVRPARSSWYRSSLVTGHRWTADPRPSALGNDAAAVRRDHVR